VRMVEFSYECGILGTMVAVRVFLRVEKVLWLVLESYDTLVAVSAPLVMPVHDSDMSMNVPFTFRKKQTITTPPDCAQRLRDPRMSEHILTRKHQAHKHHTHTHAASGWRIHCGFRGY
jgi:hypothetical protein